MKPGRAAGFLSGGRITVCTPAALLVFGYIITATVVSYSLWYSVVKKYELSKLFIIKMAEPVLEPEKVIVEIYATALNRADLLQKQGTYPSPAGWPSWMGLELSGKIIEMGETAREKSRFQVGDMVCTLVGGGAYAEKIAILLFLHMVRKVQKSGGFFMELYMVQSLETHLFFGRIMKGYSSKIQLLCTGFHGKIGI